MAKYLTLAEALARKGLTQQSLSALVRGLNRRRPNGKKMKVSQNFISQLVNGERRAGVDVAEAICAALDYELDPAVLVFGSDRDERLRRHPRVPSGDKAA
jgi:transcriptional regulator with XRE-family HTH domain